MGQTSQPKPAGRGDVFSIIDGMLVLLRLLDSQRTHDKCVLKNEDTNARRQTEEKPTADPGL